MKKILVLVIILTTITTYGQEIFKDGKKYGVSKNGGNPANDKNDSLIYRAEYDEIERVGSTDYVVFKAMRDDEWSFLTNNKLVNQQRYDEITVPEFDDRYALGKREGYIDVVDLNASEFLIRGVKADDLYNSSSDLDLNNAIMTTTGKDFYGVINTETKKEILKCEYTSIQYNNDDVKSKITILAFKDGVNYLFDMGGTVIFKFETGEIVTQVAPATVEGSYNLRAEGKKAENYGFYEEKNKWYVPPVYSAVEVVDNDPAVVIVSGAKGYGLYFQGKQILPCEYASVEKSDKQGYVALVWDKKSYFYLADDGRLIPKTD